MSSDKGSSNRLSSEDLRRRVRFVVVAAIVFLAGLGVFHYFYDWPFLGTGSTTKTQALPALEKQVPLEANELQKFMDSHGPWLSTSQSSDLRTQTGVRNLALFRANGLVYSTKSVKFDGASPWSAETTPPQITGVEVKGSTLSIQTQKGVLYTINVTQPFMLEGNTSRVYVIDRNRKLWSASAANLTFVEAITVSDNSLPINPDLSISIGN